MIFKGKFPTLRFQGFNGKWTTTQLNLFTVINPKNANIPEEFIYIDLESVYKGRLLKSNKIYKNSAPSRAQRILQEGDVLFQTVRPYQKNHFLYNKELGLPAVASTGFALLRSKHKQSNEFLYHLLYTSRFDYEVSIRCTGSSYPAINSSDLSEIEIIVPSLMEQQKIASFFTLIDKKISKQQEKIEQLELYKKGMVQKLFSQEIRFKDENGQDFLKWKKVKFREISKKVGPRNKDGKEYPVYSISNRHGFILQNEQFEDSRLEDLDKTAYKIVTKGQFAYNPARINVGSIGFSRLDEPVIVSSLYVCFELSDEVDNEFIYQFVKTRLFHKEVLKNLEGSVREYLFYENFGNIKVNLPSLQEQQKISKFLSTFDEKIKKEIEKLGALQQQKKGFLQQMFI